jgi:ABC-type multidrug transport system ATPase subunit
MFTIFVLGEMVVGPSRVLFMDEISTGLDSSTTYQIVNALRRSIHILQGTTVVSLLQPAPETYDLFDDIILISDGQIVYQGPREHVLEFFESMGFKCPERKGVADFLQEVYIISQNFTDTIVMVLENALQLQNKADRSLARHILLKVLAF